MLYIRQFFVLLVALYTARVLLRVLGVADYGIYNVVGGVVSILGFLNGAMVSATQRFLAFDIGVGDKLKVKKTFNSTLVIHLCLAFLVFIITETVGRWFIDNYLVIPSERYKAALWVYHFSILSLMVTIIQVPYNALVIANEKMEFYAYISIVDVVLKLVVVVLIQFVDQAYDHLILYGGLFLLATIITASIYLIYIRSNFQEAKFEIYRDIGYYRTLLSYSGWSIFGNLAGVLKIQGINMLMNIFFGPAVNAAQAIAHQTSAALSSFQTNFQMASNPQIIKNYAEQKEDSMLKLTYRTSKFSVLLLALLCIPAILEMDFLLKIWLSTVPQWASSFAILALIDCMITSIAGSLMIAIQATGKIARYQLIISTILIISLPLTYMAYRMGTSPLYAYYFNIFLSITAVFARYGLIKEQIKGFSPREFSIEAIIKPTLIIGIALVPSLMVRSFLPTSFYRLLIVSFISSTILLISTYYLGISLSERQFIIQYIQRIFRHEH